MYFYVDETGHTGLRIFDPDQPMLSYGVLSSSLNLDVLCEETLAGLRRKLGVERIHAAELGNKGLSAIAPELIALQKSKKLRFDIYRVNKPDHAVISFFDQVFDSGMNPAVTWTGYWTPLRYVLLLKLAQLFDEPTAKKAWQARIETNDSKSEAMLTEVCRELAVRVSLITDARSRQIIGDTLNWAAKNPNEIYFNAKSKKDTLQISPNLIGFQCVMRGIADRVKKSRRDAVRITVDQQSEFNKAQSVLANFYASAKGVQLVNGPGLPKLDHSGIPSIPLTFASSKASAGLELVDVHLWIFKRVLDNQLVSSDLIPLVISQKHRTKTDEVSLSGIARRWECYFDNLPDPSNEQLMDSAEMLAIDEARRLRAVQENQ